MAAFLRGAVLWNKPAARSCARRRRVALWTIFLWLVNIVGCAGRPQPGASTSQPPLDHPARNPPCPVQDCPVGAGLGPVAGRRRGWGAIPQPVRRRPTRPGNRRARAFPSIVHVRGESVQRRAPPGRCLRRHAGRGIRSCRRAAWSAQPSPNEPGAARELRTNPSRTRMRTNPAASEPERTQAGREVAQTPTPSIPNEPKPLERVRIAASGIRTNPSRSRIRPNPEPERTQAVDSCLDPGALESGRTRGRSSLGEAALF